MRCEAAQRALSRAMDGDGPLDRGVAVHVEGCSACAGFRDGALRVRQAVRLAPAPEVPDRTRSIMAAVGLLEPDAPLELGGRFGPERDAGTERRPRAARRGGPLIRALAAALAAGLVLGFAVTRTDLILGRGPAPALAAEVPRGLLRTAMALRGYRATFDVVERNFARAVPTRTFVASVAFRAPEDFRVSVRDTTAYPSPAWPRNDLLLVTDDAAWSVAGPDPCPPASLPACPASPSPPRTLVGRPPFDRDTAMPTDVIVPMTVLAAERQVTVTGAATVAGHRTVRVELPFDEAASLLQAIQFRGSWRPFFPQDRVDVWLDRSSWLPIRFEVHPAPGPERALWATRAGLPRESPSVAIFSATARALSTTPPPATLFAVRVPGSPARGEPAAQELADQGFRPLAVQAAPGWVRPTDTDGLPMVRYGRFVRPPDGAREETVAAYAQGLAWVTVTRVAGWTALQAFGVDGFAESVRVGAGVGYYEPAGGPAMGGGGGVPARRVSLHTPGAEVLVESDLPRDTLLRIAGSLPVTGLPHPVAWRERRWAGGRVLDGLTAAEALRRARFAVRMPPAGTLPRGYRAVGAELTTVGGVPTVSIAFRHAVAEPDGEGLRLTVAPAAALPPPTDPAEVEVAVGASAGRWSPDRHVLEWVDGGLFLSLSGPDFDLSSLVAIAASIQAGTDPSPTSAPASPSGGIP